MDRLLEVRGLSKHYVVKRNVFAEKNIIRAVDNISFEIDRGETLALIGESGCGKSTTAALILRLIECDSGEIIYDGRDLTKIDGASMRGLRKNMQIIFQHTQGAMDPKMTIEELLIEPLKIHNIVMPSEYDSEVKRLLNLVGISDKERHKFPLQISGGQRQRIGIARALAPRPEFIVCDEPVSALDVSVQGQILNLLQDIKEEFNLTYLFISHDLRVVRHICDRIAVMYKGRIIETGERENVLSNPREGYTRNLINSVL